MPRIKNELFGHGQQILAAAGTPQPLLPVVTEVAEVFIQAGVNNAGVIYIMDKNDVIVAELAKGDAFEITADTEEADDSYTTIDLNTIHMDGTVTGDYVRVSSVPEVDNKY